LEVTLEERSPFTRILVPTDGSEPSISAGLLAIRIAATHNVPVVFLYVVDAVAAEKMANATSRTVNTVSQDLASKGQSYLDYLARLARRRGLQTEQVVRYGIPHREIADMARERSIDLIVVGLAGSHWTHRVDIGSVSKRVLESAPCPVLVARYDPGER
jgi:nucleotide-binding universal stress UspA family protein